MTKIAYLECKTGIAGDMCLGALVDIGVPLAYLIEKLKGLGIDSEYRLREEKVKKNGQLATKVFVDLLTEEESSHQHNHDHHSHSHHHHHPPARHLPEIERLIQQAGLPPKATDWSLQVFRQLAIAEGAVHGIEPEKVHFHEVGATDAIVDIVGTCLGLDWLSIDELYCSPLPTGGGIVKAAHGKLPVPVPAVLKLWESREVPVYNNGIESELVTPTGAAIVVTLAKDFISPPPMKFHRVGLGAGTKDLLLPNLVRLWLGESAVFSDSFNSSTQISESLSPTLETIAVLETQVDDLNPQAIGYIFDRLFEAGAVDVFTQGIGMKKSRPGILLTVICPMDVISTCEGIIFRETTTLGIRRLIQERAILDRRIDEVDTVYGKVRVKVASIGRDNEKKIINVQPEYEDCARLARENSQPLREIQQMVLHNWYSV